MTDIANKVRLAIVDKYGVTYEEVTNETTLIEGLKGDSLDIVELVMLLEERFEIEIPDKDAEKFVTVGDVIEYMKSKVGEDA